MKANQKVILFSQSSMPVDIGSVMAQRLSAMRKLQVDRTNVVATKQIDEPNSMPLPAEIVNQLIHLRFNFHSFLL